MNEIISADSIPEYNALRGLETLHPLVSVFELSKLKPIQNTRIHFGFYCVYLKDSVCGDLKYGCNYYDYQEGTLVFIGPGQVVGINIDPANYNPKGWGLLFHPDLIKGTSLGRNIREYTFFSYEMNEALHISERERQIIIDCFKKIEYEVSQPVDKHSKKLIANNIELLLNYCLRFYDRQFITRSEVNKSVLAKFENLLYDYFQSDLPHTEGLPTVKYFADKLHLSPNYFGDLIKKETGKSAQEHVQMKLIDIAKERIFDTSKTISEIAYELGFRHPQHFSRMFKNETGRTPVEYRSMN